MTEKFIVGKIEQLTQEPIQTNYLQVLGEIPKIEEWQITASKSQREIALEKQVEELKTELAKFKKILPHKPFVLKKYNTIEEVRAASWGLTLEEFMDCDEEQIGYDDDGNEVKFSQAQEIKNLKKMGYWGFVHLGKNENTIHVWHDKNINVTLEELIFFFGHEIGHATGTTIEGEIEDVLAGLEEEKRADSYGNVANLAFKFATDLMKST